MVCVRVGQLRSAALLGLAPGFTPSPAVYSLSRTKDTKGSPESKIQRTHFLVSSIKATDPIRGC